jgi:hypothetical protein
MYHVYLNVTQNIARGRKINIYMGFLSKLDVFSLHNGRGVKKISVIFCYISVKGLPTSRILLSSKGDWGFFVRQATLKPRWSDSNPPIKRL